ncbi:unnamed protein product [Closterium sp. NIES-54]
MHVTKLHFSHSLMLILLILASPHSIPVTSCASSHSPHLSLPTLLPSPLLSHLSHHSSSPPISLPPPLAPHLVPPNSLSECEQRGSAPHQQPLLGAAHHLTHHTPFPSTHSTPPPPLFSSLPPTPFPLTSFPPEASVSASREAARHTNRPSLELCTT